MKSKCGILHVAAFAFLMSVPGAGAAYPKYQAFDSGTTSGWLSATAYLTNAAVASGSAIVLPGAGSGSVLSNVSDEVAGKVWTDFWTVPVPYHYGAYQAPAIDATATVQIFAKTNGYWVAFSGNGSGGYLTNVLTTVLSSTDTNYPLVATNDTPYYRVSILSDYTAGTYSLFVNQKCLATNLAFMCTPGATRWFQMTNLSINANSRGLLDEYWQTNTMTGVFTNEIAGGGITQSDALYYFGTVSPRAVANDSAAGGTTVTWTLNVIGNQNDPFLVQGGATPSSFTAVTHNGTLDANTFDSTELASNSKYFYRVIRKSGVDNSITVTNSEIYAAYKQTRERYRSYIVGVPVIPIGSDATLAGPIGEQLAKGLAAGDKLTVYVNGSAKVFTRDAGLSWSQFSGGTAPGALTFTSGMGVLIQASGDAADRDTILAGVLQTNTTSISLASGNWNIVAWPYETAGTLGAAFGGSHTANDTVSGYLSGDYAWIQRQGSINPIQARYITGGWVQYFNRTNGSSLNNLSLQAGDGVIVKPAGAGLTWVPAQ